MNYYFILLLIKSGHIYNMKPLNKHFRSIHRRQQDKRKYLHYISFIYDFCLCTV